jgi:hypothetical protein
MLLDAPYLFPRIYRNRSRSDIFMIRKFATIRYTRHFLRTASAFENVLPEFSEYDARSAKKNLTDLAFKESIADGNTDPLFWR